MDHSIDYCESVFLSLLCVYINIPTECGSELLWEKNKNPCSVEASLWNQLSGGTEIEENHGIA